MKHHSRCFPYIDGEGNGNPLQYPCLENLMDRGACWAAVKGIAKHQAQLTNTYSR